MVKLSLQKLIWITATIIWFFWYITSMFPYKCEFALLGDCIRVDFLVVPVYFAFIVAIPTGIISVLIYFYQRFRKNG